MKRVKRRELGRATFWVLIWLLPGCAALILFILSHIRLY